MDPWQHANVGATPGFDGDTVAALGSIRAPGLDLPAEKDLYFPPEDERWAGEHVASVEVREIPGVWGHFAGGGAHEQDVAFIDAAVREVLAMPPA